MFHFRLFANDLHISIQVSKPSFAQLPLQSTLNQLEKWADNHGFTFSKDKTYCVFFHRKRKSLPNPNLILYSTPLTLKQFIRFLGMIFDYRSIWNEHIIQTRAKCIKKISILKILSHPSTSSYRKKLLFIYRTLVLLHLNYSRHLLVHANKTSLAILDSIHTSIIRIATGAFRTTPSPSLFCESSEPPLYIRPIHLTSNLLCNTYLNLNTQIYELLFGRIWRSFYFSSPTPQKKYSFLIPYFFSAPYLSLSFLIIP